MMTISSYASKYSLPWPFQVAWYCRYYYQCGPILFYWIMLFSHTVQDPIESELEQNWFAIQLCDCQNGIIKLICCQSLKAFRACYKLMVHPATSAVVIIIFRCDRYLGFGPIRPILILNLNATSYTSLGKLRLKSFYRISSESQVVRALQFVRYNLVKWLLCFIHYLWQNKVLLPV